MPDDYSKRLSGDEVTNLVAYLCAQDGRDYSQTIRQPLAGGLPYERIVNSAAEPQNWLTYWGDYRGTHYSPLSQINLANVRQLRPAWTFPILIGDSLLEGTPLVVDGVMYTTGGGNPASVIRARRPDRPADLVLDPPAKGGEPLPDKSLQPRGRPAGQPPVCRHPGRCLDRPRRADGPEAVGGAGRRHPGRLQHHERAARLQGQGDHRHRRRRVRHPRLCRRLRRRHGQAPLAVLHDSRSGRVWPRDLAGRQLEDRRRPDLADRLLRSGAEPAVLGRGQSGRAGRPVPARATWTICSATRSSPSTRTPAP